jgi:hypothetical protein
MNKRSVRNLAIFLLIFSFNKSVIADDLTEKEPGSYTFTCGGLILSDHGMAMDREGYFYNENPHQLICVFAMGAVSCATTKKGQLCTCPPPEWKANKCTEKLEEFSKARDLEWRKKYDELIKKQNKP